MSLFKHVMSVKYGFDSFANRCILFAFTFYTNANKHFHILCVVYCSIKEIR